MTTTMTNPYEPEDDDAEPAPEHGTDAATAPAATDPAAADPAATATVDDPPVTDPGQGPDDDLTDWPMWYVMPATDGGGATTLAEWCACAAELPREPGWAPPGADASPWLVVTAPRTVDGIRRARQLSGALTATPSGTRVAAIALLEPAPIKGAGSGLQLKEMVAAAEAAGVRIITVAHDPELTGKIKPPQGDSMWTPFDAGAEHVPRTLRLAYSRIFAAIQDQEQP